MIVFRVNFSYPWWSFYASFLFHCFVWGVQVSLNVFLWSNAILKIFILFSSAVSISLLPSFVISFIVFTVVTKYILKVLLLTSSLLNLPIDKRCEGTTLLFSTYWDLVCHNLRWGVNFFLLLGKISGTWRRDPHQAVWSTILRS